MFIKLFACPVEGLLINHLQKQHSTQPSKEAVKPIERFLFDSINRFAELIQWFKSFLTQDKA